MGLGNMPRGQLPLRDQGSPGHRAFHQMKLRELEGMDFDDLIMETVMMFRATSATRQVPEEVCPYPVDEYQDKPTGLNTVYQLPGRAHRIY